MTNLANLKREPLNTGPIPLYYQLEKRIRDRIEAGEFNKGDALPTEGRMCSEYNVSRITVRRALDGLQQQGLIERHRGVGSFVSEKKSGINSYLTGSLNEFLSIAGSLTTKCISLAEMEPPHDIAARLELIEGELAVHMRALGSLGDEPVTFLEIWLPLKIGSMLSVDQLSGQVPVIRLVEQAANLQITRGEQIIEPGRAGEQAGHFLGISAETPVLHAQRTYFSGKRVIEVANAVYHPERYRYAIEFKG